MKTGVKRVIALCVCCLLLAAAIVQNVYTNRKKNAAVQGGATGNSDVLANGSGNGLQAGTQPGNGESGDQNGEQKEATGIKCDSVEDFLAALRLERDESRSLAAEACMTVIESEEASGDEKAKAQETVQSISLMQEIEKSVETTIRGEGYDDVFACFDSSGSFDITVVAENMTQDEVMAIACLVQSAAGVDMGALSVQSVYEPQ